MSIRHWWRRATSTEKSVMQDALTADGRYVLYGGNKYRPTTPISWFRVDSRVLTRHGPAGDLIEVLDLAGDSRELWRRDGA